MEIPKWGEHCREVSNQGTDMRQRALHAARDPDANTKRGDNLTLPTASAREERGKDECSLSRKPGLTCGPLHEQILLLQEASGCDRRQYMI